jgi:hypothetical protein
MARNGLLLLCAVLIVGTIELSVVARVAAQSLGIETNAPIFKVKPGGSEVKDIVVYGTGADSMQITDIKFGNGRELFRLANELPVKAIKDNSTGKLRADMPVIVSLPPEIQKDTEYPFTVTVTSGQKTAQVSSYVLVSVIPSGTADDSMGFSIFSIWTILYIVMAAGGIVSILVYKKIAKR